MSAVPPVIRHMLLCQEVRREPALSGRVSLLGLFSSIRADPSETYPLSLPDFCVFMLLTGGRGKLGTRVVVREADSESMVYQTPVHDFVPAEDPLRVRGLTVFLHNVSVPHPGLYWVQFCHNEGVLAEESLAVR